MCCLKYKIVVVTKISAADRISVKCCNDGNTEIEIVHTVSQLSFIFWHISDSQFVGLILFTLYRIYVCGISLVI